MLIKNSLLILSFVLDVYTGVFLPKLCAAKGANARRQMAEIKSSGIVAPGPVHSLQFTAISPQPFDAVELADEPAVAPFPQY